MTLGAAGAGMGSWPEHAESYARGSLGVHTVCCINVFMDKA